MAVAPISFDPSSLALAKQQIDLVTSHFLEGSSSFMLGVVETFDGSTIVDPVVVGTAFWTSLKAKFLAVIIGQLLATLVFAILSSFIAQQVSNLTQAGTNQMLDNFLGTNKDNNPQQQQQTFRKATEFQTSQTRPMPDFSKLLVCLAIDVLGSANEVLPVVGEVVDVLYAPLAATLVRNLFGGSNVLFALEFAEEILPFTDILPLATICWTIESFLPDSDLARVLQLGSYNPSTGMTIDVSIDTSLVKQENDDDTKRK